MISPWLYKNLPYDSLKDFTPVVLVASGPYVVVVNPQLPVGTVRELIAAAKAQPGEDRLRQLGQRQRAAPGRRAVRHDGGLDLNHVPYKGSGPAMQDLLAGR